MKPTNLQIRQFHALLFRTHMQANKVYMLASYGVESTKDLKSNEIDELIYYLQGIENEKAAKTTKELREWRHKVLRMVAACGIDTQDWTKVNSFVCQPRIFGKHLYQGTVDELKNLHRKLHNVANEKKKQCQTERFLASLN